MTTRILRNFLSPLFKGLCLLTSSLLIASCGGGGGGGTTVGGGGIGGTGSVASVGVATAVASVTVNGVTYSCIGATVVVDDSSTPPSGSDDSCVKSQGNGQLRPGMVVVVKGNKDASGNFVATTVTAQSNVTGPATSIDTILQSFTVLSQFIDVDDNTRIELNGAKSTGVAGLTALAALPANTVVQVSGLPNNQGRILATFVETKTRAISEFEVKGVVSNATSTGFNIGALNVVLNNQAAQANGQCVEAKGSFSGGTLTLSSIKNDNDCSGSVSGSFSQAQVEGIVSGVTTPPPTDFLVAGQSVKIDANTVFSGGTALDLINGVKVEAEGSITNGVLLAKKLTIKSNGVRIEGRPDAAATGNSFTILGITVKVVAATEFGSGISLGSIGPGASVRIEGSKSGAKQVTASKITNGSGGGGGTRTELRGPLDTDAVDPNMTILGVPITVTSSATFKHQTGTSISRSAFFAAAKANNVVKARGSESPDNNISATEVEIED